MRQDMKNDDGGANRFLSQLAAEKKKVSIALCLIAMMAVMWARVLTKKGPQGADAAPAIEQTDVEDQLNEAMKLSFVELPEVPGRNDLISRDFFALDGWQDFKPGEEENDTVEIEELSVTPIDESGRVAAIVKQHLRLQGIVMGRKPQAFINDKLLSVAERIVVTDGAGTYECEVTEIRESSVLIRCREAEIVLKLVQTAEGDG